MTMVQPEQQWDTDRVLTVPNIVSFVRLLGIPLFGWFIVAGHDVWAVALLAAFGATDWLDGFLARRLRQRTALGAKLDPVADRLYILTAIVSLFVRGLVPWWLLALLLARDVMLAALVPFLRRTGRVALPVTRTGKAGTLCLLVAFPLLLLGSPTVLSQPVVESLGWAVVAAGTLLYWAAGYQYVRGTVLVTREHRRGSA